MICPRKKKRMKARIDHCINGIESLAAVSFQNIPPNETQLLVEICYGREAKDSAAVLPRMLQMPNLLLFQLHD